MKVVEVLELHKGLLAIGAERVPIRTRHKLVTVRDLAEPEVKRFAELQRKLFEEYGIKDEKAGRITVPKEKQEEFIAQVNALLTADSEVAIKPCLTLEDFGTAVITEDDYRRIRCILIEPEAP